MRGLELVAPGDRPPIAIVHLAFQAMVGLGTAMALVALWSGWLAWRGRDPATHPRLRRALVLVAPFGFLATGARKRSSRS